MRKIVGILICALLMTTTPFALADWDPEDGHEMHFPQLPDPNGWDVYATAGLDREDYLWMVLADDWLCTESGWIKDIHFWGSWMNDNIGVIDYFVLTISDNIPANPPRINYSRPGQTLWEAYIYEWKERGPYHGVQGWFIPPDKYNYPDHTMYFQYNIFLNEKEWFWQEEGKIYWLGISAIVREEPNDQPLWGWKSSIDHWNDDAVAALWYELDWIDLWEPPDFKQSLDLAFVITGGKEEEPMPDLDCEGDLRWVDVKPGSTVTGTIYVKNIGDAGSKLDWEVCEKPTWGTWTFNPLSGQDLTPADGAKAITVTVVAPNQQNQQFTGQIKIWNKNDNTDYEIIQVLLITPKNKRSSNCCTIRVSTAISQDSQPINELLFLQFFEKLRKQFPLIYQLIYSHY
jgi:hypothetical protein